eukprot:11212661-Lingulodinium_polyedra.AAC.1
MGQQRRAQDVDVLKMGPGPRMRFKKRRQRVEKITQEPGYPQKKERMWWRIAESNVGRALIRRTRVGMKPWRM